MPFGESAQGRRRRVWRSRSDFGEPHAVQPRALAFPIQLANARRSHGSTWPTRGGDAKPWRAAALRFLLAQVRCRPTYLAYRTGRAPAGPGLMMFITYDGNAAAVAASAAKASRGPTASCSPCDTCDRAERSIHLARRRSGRAAKPGSPVHRPNEPHGEAPGPQRFSTPISRAGPRDWRRYPLEDAGAVEPLGQIVSPASR